MSDYCGKRTEFNEVNNTSEESILTNANFDNPLPTVDLFEMSPHSTSSVHQVVEETAVHYFSYGSNMNPERIQARGVTWFTREVACLTGYKLCFNKRANGSHKLGYANIVPDSHSKVWGILYEVSEASIELLDLNEGVPAGHYQRKTVIIDVGDTEKVAQVYIACANRIADGLAPRLDHLVHLQRAYPPLPAEYAKMLNEITPAIEKMEKVFVYGTLKQGYRNHDYLEAYQPQSAKVQDVSLYEGPGFPYAGANVGDMAHGEVYEVTAHTLEELDLLEGHPCFYNRKLLQVTINDNKKVEAWVYLYEKASAHPIIESGLWPTDSITTI